jgi:rhodanese-related sulfurtransferase
VKVVPVLLVLLVGWELAWWTAGVRPMLPGKLEALQEGGSGVRIIDVRTTREYEWFHIAGAESHPDLLFHPEALWAESRDTHLVLICLSGHRAPVAAFRLKRLGFKKVSYLSWGMLAWMAGGGRTVAGKGERVFKRELPDSRRTDA